jgi:uncharacterized membrane protein YoaK (UPF0700 family)
MKKNYPLICALVGLFGLNFSRYMIAQYGENSVVIIGAITLSLCIICLFVLIVKKQYYQSVALIILIIPIIVMQIGEFLDNNVLGVIELILMVFSVIALNKILPKYKKD